MRVIGTLGLIGGLGALFHFGSVQVHDPLALADAFVGMAMGATCAAFGGMALAH